MSITITGLDKLKASAAKVAELAQAFGDEFVARVKEKTPVDTGLLQNSWELEVNQKSINVTNQAVNERGEPYSAYVEFGTEHVPGVFMLNRTILEVDDIMNVAKAKVGLT
jgi:hypothetical protein